MPRVPLPVGADPRQVTEALLYNFVRDCARQASYRLYHTWLSKFSEAGFPDLVMVRGQRIIWAELKGHHGKASHQQREWLTDLRAVDPDGRGRDVYLWYPYHMDAIPLVMFGQGPHRDGCPDDTEWRSDPKAPEAQWCGVCGRWRLAI